MQDTGYPSPWERHSPEWCFSSPLRSNGLSPAPFTGGVSVVSAVEPCPARFKAFTPVTAVANRFAGNPRPWQAAARWTLSSERKQSSLQNSEPRDDGLSRIFATQSPQRKNAPHQPQQSRFSSCAGTARVLGLLLRRGAIPQRSPFPERWQPRTNEFPIR